MNIPQEKNKQGRPCETPVLSHLSPSSLVSPLTCSLLWPFWIICRLHVLPALLQLRIYIECPCPRMSFPIMLNLHNPDLVDTYCFGINGIHSEFLNVDPSPILSSHGWQGVNSTFGSKDEKVIQFCPIWSSHLPGHSD